MRFRFIGTIQGLLLSEGISLELRPSGAHQISVLLRRPSEEEVQSGHAPTQTFFVVEGCWATVSEKISQAFSALAQRRLPDGWQRADGWQSQVDNEGRFTRVDIVSSRLLPGFFQDFQRQAYDELRQTAHTLISTVQWRRGLRGPHNPLAQVSFRWSSDGTTWHHMPNAGGSILEVHRGQRFSFGFGDEIVELVAHTGGEPLAHELLREAWCNRIQNRRSSLLMGITAAEVGLKQCIAALAPSADWLIHNLPSPPIDKILKEFLPLLQAKLNFQGKVLPPPPAVMDALKKGVQIRNQITHKGAEAPKYETLEDILLAVSDLLWQFDYYCGFSWSLDHMREEVRQQLLNVSGNF